MPLAKVYEIPHSIVTAGFRIGGLYPQLRGKPP